MTKLIRHLVDADELKKWVDDSVSQYGNRYSTDILNMFGLFKEVIDKASTVVTDYDTSYQDGLEDGFHDIRPQGEWIKDEEHSITINMFRCSNCNGGGYLHFKYCPHCGAEMGGENE